MARVHRSFFTFGAGLVLWVCSAMSMAQAQTLANADPDQTFVALREAARVNNAPLAAQLAAQLSNYPVPSYVEYFTLKPQMFDSGGHAQVAVPDQRILAFLQRYDGQAIADRLRNDYLLVLGARHDWRDFDAQYPRFVLDDDTQVKCYALEARAAHGQAVGDAARALLTDPKSYGDGCVDLINALAANGQFGADDVWSQIRLAYEGNYISLAKRIADALGPERPDDKLFDAAANKPPLVLTQKIATNTPAHQLALLAVIRAAANDPAQTAALYDAEVAPRLTPEERAIGWGEIGFRGALKQMPEALGWYRQSVNAPLSNPAYEWRVRAALAAQDWRAVLSSIESMPESLRAKPVWIYWLGRALAQTGNPAAAVPLYQQIAPQYNFYGQLATEELGMKITLPPRTTVTDAEVDAMRKVPGFLLAERFYAMNLRFEGNREWNWALRGMSDRQLLAAAEYARRIELFDRTVNTADRTQVEHDFTLRYLTPFRDIVETDALATHLDVEWAYGLIRQESRFIINARSGVGASGLMQLMPGTAALVARKMGLGKLSPDEQSDINTNIKLGTYYLASIYDQFDDSPVLASAGYNAGPGRSRQWRAALTQPVEGAIFAETIPFNETREYVENVLSNTVYYAALLEGGGQSLKARLGIISP